MTPVIVGVAALAVGVVVGFLVRANMAKSSANTLEARARQRSMEADSKVLEANQEAAAILRRSTRSKGSPRVMTRVRLSRSVISVLIRQAALWIRAR